MRKLHGHLLKLDSRIRDKTRSLISLDKKINARIRKIEEESGSPQELAELRKARHDIGETLGKIRFEGVAPDFTRGPQPR